jgi:hypothetical protein
MVLTIFAVSGQGKGSDKDFEIGEIDYTDFKKKNEKKKPLYDDDESEEEKPLAKKKVVSKKDVLSSETSGYKSKNRYGKKGSNYDDDGSSD